MARYYDVHPVDPQPRTLDQVVALLREDGLLAYPTDSGYALGIQLGNRDGLERIKRIRQLDHKHHFTLVCRDFAQLGQLVHVDNAAFRAVKAATPGPYTFILPATAEVPRRLMHPKKRTVGVRIPTHVVVRELLDRLGEPLLSSTLILPGQDRPMTDGWQVKEELDHVVDAVIDAGEVLDSPTTVVDFSSGTPEIARYGAGDPTRFA
jgi:tRNA threonylcarbamoyl adenosine modification protein (Sua5/YciO/YrdC/YwlC family)